MSTPTDRELDAHARKSHNDRFVEAIESLDRRVESIERTAAAIAAESRATAAATAKIAQRSIFWPVLGALITFTLLPLIVMALVFVLGIGAGLLGAATKSISDQVRPAPTKTAPPPTTSAAPPVRPQPSRPTPPVARVPSGLTLQNYNSIREGMDYSEVQKVLGIHGQEASRTETGSDRTVVMRWDLPSPAGAYVTVTFTNGKVTDKQQVGLE